MSKVHRLLAAARDKVTQMLDFQILALHGDIDILRRSWLEDELDTIRLSGPQTATILDLTDVGFADSTLLNALTLMQERAESERCSKRICIVAGTQISRLFELTMLDDVFAIFPDVTSARLYLLTEQPAGDRSIREWQSRFQAATETTAALSRLLDEINSLRSPLTMSDYRAP